MSRNKAPSGQSVWMLQTKRADFDAWAKKFHISPVVARIIRNRDVTEEQDVDKYLHGTVRDLYNPHLLKDMDCAVSILIEKIKNEKSIRIVGDYDIDGICSTYLLFQGISRCGGKVDYQIPERIQDGYGINEGIIQKAEEDGIDTIITCDNGISAISQIQLAKEMGMTVIVTDHHETVKGEDGSQILPPADAVVNPKQEECTYPFPEICGGVVAYKVIQVLFEQLKIPMEEWEGMLEFAAIATVGDVMRLKNENRILVKEGLRQLPKSKSVGLLALAEACGIDIYHVNAYHVGFVIGPCLNASGRLQTAKKALELLLCQDRKLADEMALELKELNEERKTMTAKGVEDALAQVEEKYLEDKVLVLYLPNCHESLAGIIAGRVREAWYRPTLVLTKGEGCVKGSGRSIEGYHMYEGLCGVQEFLLRFGGHPMAAGFSLEEKNIDEFRRRLNEQAQLTEEDFVPKIWIDVAMPLEYISQRLVEELKLLEPFGQGNEKPQFAQKNLQIRSVSVLGKHRNAVKLSLVTQEGFPMSGMLFTEGDRFLEELGNKKCIDVIYYPDVNEYNGNRSLQIIVRDYKLHEL